MELRSLRFFVAVAEEESFTRAANRLLVAQPAVSQQIRSLERELGERLFDRSTRSVQLTEAGRALVPLARKTLDAAEELTAEFASRTALLTGVLALGTVDGVEHTALPAMLGAFHDGYPGVTVHLRDGRSADLLARVEAGSLDAAVVALPTRPLPVHFRSETLLQDEIVVVVRTDAPLAAREKVPVEMLGGRTFVTYAPDSGIRPWLDQVFRAADLDLAVRYATNDVALQVALVEAGIGVALAVRSHQALVETRTVTALPLDPPLRFEKALVWRTAPPPSRPLRAFLALRETSHVHVMRNSRTRGPL
ncbi:LysR family transcriptional regulator [Actinacidiphila guanduensis]|uniref:DNA-binding transcriptional regulator, LysR family n=1 Tax=Actinacidiphila guanduensis TaxID=310781 RepID=A0A1H0S3X5_9ACTN|nr:LysR family transcriptional regulator [Actinacidiphila guanduensis]SDP36325.1 DNA-binding transcriptional regulator, LysR family [Actinacidiphila guanduensis]